MDRDLYRQILLYATAKLREKRIITLSEVNVMIDDALFCFFFAKKATQEEKEMKCKSIKDAITDTYAELGLVIAKDKMIISMHNFTFLN